LLADLGANVVKVEDPRGGDYARGLQRVGNAPATNGAGESVLFHALNRNKRSVAIDLKSEAGRDLFFELVENCDLFVCGFRDDAANRLGVAPSVLLERNPKLVYVKLSALGALGNEGQSPGVDLIGLARCGILASQGRFWENPGALHGIADASSSMMTVVAALAGLNRARETGQGGVVSTSMLAAMTSLLATRLSVKLGAGAEAPHLDRLNVANPLYNVYRASDGEWLCIALAFQSDRDWPALCDALDAGYLTDDRRFSSFEARSSHSRILVEIFDDILSQRTRSEWLVTLRKYDICAGPVNNLSDLVDDPQAIENRYIVSDSFGAPASKTLGFPIESSTSQPELVRPAPELGQHTEEVIQEFLDLSWDEIADLNTRGAFG
jgi:crotonobetainyl-CoA:carnitine CoA-transferase CaiB-like acyl-CoA transferase